MALYLVSILINTQDVCKANVKNGLIQNIANTLCGWIGVGAGKFMVVRRNFARISSKLFEKFLCAKPVTNFSLKKKMKTNPQSKVGTNLSDTKQNFKIVGVSSKKNDLQFVSSGASIHF